MRLGYWDLECWFAFYRIWTFCHLWARMARDIDDSNSATVEVGSCIWKTKRTEGNDGLEDECSFEFPLDTAGATS